nr:hypothetical protein [uncultured Blautia sp.]
MIKKKYISEKEEASLDATSPEQLDYLVKNGDYSVRLAVARNNNTSPETLSQLAKDESIFIQRSVAINPHTPDNTLRQFVFKKIFLKEVAGNRNTSEETLREILFLQPDPDARGIKNMFQRRITQEELTEVFKIALKHPNLPKRCVDEFLKEGKLSVHDIHEIKASRKELPFSLKVRDFLPYIRDNDIALLAYTEDVQKSIVLASFSSEDVEDKASLEESINFWRKERKLTPLPSENFSADDLLDATIVRIETFPPAMHGSKSTIAITIREIEETKGINYFL